MREKSILRVIVSALLAGLCTFSAVRMIRDVFPDTFYMDVNAVIFSIMIVAVLALAYEAGDLRGRAGWILPGILLILLFGYLLARHEALLSGLLKCCRQYLNYVNKYYKTAFYLKGPGGSIEQIPEALGFVVLFVLTVLYLIAVMFQKYQVLLIFPAAVLSMELMVGYCPKWLGIALFAIAAALTASRSWRVRHQERSFAYLAMALLLVFGVCSLFMGKAAEQVSGRQMEMLEFQHNIEKWAMRSLNIKAWKNPGAVDNHEPQYENKEVLELWWKDYISSDPIYLRGFYGTDYRYRQWVKDQKGFQEACKNQGADPEQTAKRIANMPYSAMYTQMRVSECRLTDKGTLSDYAYLPYYANMKSFSDYDVSGDYEVKRLWDSGDSLSFYMGMYGDEGIWGTGLSAAVSGYVPAWYDAFAYSEYLTAAEEVPAAEAYAESVKKAMLQMMPMGDEPETGYAPENMQTGQLNAMRIMYADLTAQLLEQTCIYSQSLEELPGEADPVEYFLSTSHRGYCVHFASAGTLILRSLGVPARYASGYVAKTENCTADNNGYTIQVLDSNAHAWTEIYLDGIGWVPMEMTPGAMTAAEWEKAVGDVPFQKPDLSHGQTGLEDPMQGDTETPGVTEPTETQQNTEESSEVFSNSQEEPESVPEQETAESETGSGSTGGTGSGTGSGSKDGGPSWLMQQRQKHKAWFVKLFRVLLSWVFLALLLFAVYRFRLHAWQRKNRAIREDMKRGRYRRSVFRMNRQLYRQLRRIGALHIKKPSDREYFKCLVRTYPDADPEDWEKFIRTAEKTAFSREGLSSEEAAHCRRLFDSYADAFSLGRMHFLWLAAFLVLAALIALAVFG